jgi:hypothetical protein
MTNPVLFHRISGMLPALLLAALGGLLVWVGRGYRTGSLTAMGPGFMPVLLGVLLVLLAALLMWRETAPQLAVPGLRPLACVAGGMLAWAALAEPLGFFPAALAQIVITAFSLPQSQRRQDLVVALGLSIAAYLLFVRVLGLPLPAFGS